MPCTVVLCDLDDTLFDHYRATRSSLTRVRALEPALAVWPIEELEARHRVALEKWHQEVLAGRASIDTARKARFTELLAAAGSTVAEARGADVAALYRETYAAEWHPVAGAVELAESIKRAGLEFVIVTNNVVVEQQLKLARCGLTPFVDALVTSEEIGVQKPDAGIFAVALARASATADGAVMLGDAWQTDIAGARAAGIRAVWLNRFGQPSPDPTVDELSSLEPATAVLDLLTGRQTMARR